MTRQVRTSVLAWGGEAAWDDLLAVVSPNCRARFSHAIGYYEWVESELAVELHQAWSQARGQDEMTLRGEDAARQILGGVQRWILRMASPTFILENAPRVFGFYYRGGRMDLVRCTPGEAELEFRATGYPGGWFEHGVPAALKVALELGGCLEVSVIHRAPESEETEPFLHRYAIHWKP